MQDTIYNLPNDEYHYGEEYREWLSSSQLKQYLVSPKWARYCRENPDDAKLSNEALQIGSLYHSALECLANNGNTLDSWQKQLVVFNPPINPKTMQPYGRDTAKYKAALDEAMANNTDKQLVSQADVDLIREMVNALLNDCGETSTQVRSMLKWGKPEVSHFVEYLGCKFKYRPDIETPKKILDWKTVSAADLHEETINRMILKFGYHISAAFYQFMEHERTGHWKEFYWVFQQKTPPYDAVFVSAQNYGFREEPDGYVAMGHGAQVMVKLLEQHIWCTENNHFDGAEAFIFPDMNGHRIMSPYAPSYETNKFFEFHNNKQQ